MPFLHCRARVRTPLVGALCLLLVICLILCLTACSPAGFSTDRFAYADTSFTATVRGTFTRTASDGYTGSPTLTGASLTGVTQPIAATVTVGAPRAGDASDVAGRDVTITFTEPPVLAGVTVTATVHMAETDGGGGTGSEGLASRTVTLVYPSDYGAVEVTDTAGALDGFLRFAEALLPIGDIAEVSPSQGDGTRTVTLRTGDGAREAVFTFVEGQTLPARVTVTSAEEVLELAVGEK